jgi:hypothetical protein
VAKKTNDNVNKDQSAKSQHGKKFEDEATAIYEQVARDINKKCGKCVVHYLGAQSEFTNINLVDGVEPDKSHVKMDHSFLIEHDKVNQAAIVLTDETTTHRGERVKSKAHEGISQMRLTPQIEQYAIEKVPHCAGYSFTHHNVLVLPDVIDGVQDPEREEAEAKKFCINVNYKRNDYATKGNCHLIDLSTKIGDWCMVIEEMATNPNKYVWDQDLLPTVWKTQHVGFDWMPRIYLNTQSALHHKERILYWLKTKPKKYTKAILNDFLRQHGISFPKSALKSILMDAVLNLIETQY